MKFILIMAIYALGSPDTGVIIGTKAFDSKAQCEQALKETPPPPPPLLAYGICLSEDEVLGKNKVSI